MKNFSLFKKIDEILFDSLEKFKNGPAYQQVINQIESLPDHQIKLVNQLVGVAVILLPFLLVIVFFVLKFQSERGLETKKEIYQLLGQMKSQESELKMLNNSVLSPVPLSGRQSLQNQMASVLTSKGIPKSSVRIENFEAATNSNLMKSTGNIVFKDFSSQNLFDFIEQMTLRQKMKIDSIEAKLNMAKSTLSGTIGLLHIAKYEEKKQEEAPKKR